MNKDFDSEILSLNRRIRDGYNYIIGNLGKIIALITAAITCMLVFTDVAFLGLDSEEFTSTLILIIISSYVMYFSLEEAGERLYEDSDDYKKLMSDYTAAAEKIGLENIGQLRDYCERYVEEELDFRIRGALLSGGFTRRDYEEFLGGKTSDKKRIKALSKIAKMRRIKLTPEMLLSHNAAKGDRICDPKQNKLLILALKLLPSTVCMIFTASVVLSAKEMSALTVIEGIVKLSALPIIGFRGYANGYNYKKENECEWLKTKTRLIEGFLDKNANNNLQKS